MNIYMVDVDIHGKRFINIYVQSLDGRHLTDTIFKVVFGNGNDLFSIKM